MGFLDRLTGRQDEPAAKREEPASTTPGEDPQELLRDFAPSSMAGPRSSGEKLYDPYAGISDALGGRKVVFKLPEGPEFVFTEEATRQRRSWTENIQYYPGVGYLAGGSTGIAVGALATLQQKPEIGMNTLKLRANRLLNSSGSWGRRFGNSMGILGMYFALGESLAYNYIGPAVPDALNTTIAGFGAAALFRSPRGIRQAAAAGVVGAVAASCLAAARQWFPDL